MIEDADEKSEDSEFGLKTFVLDGDHKVILSIPLETCHANRRRQFFIISAPATRGRPTRSSSHRHQDKGLVTMFSPRSVESPDLNYCILGVDYCKRDGKEVASLGFVLKILWGMETSLDGDGGFGIHILEKHYMFKPSNLQFLWTVIQTLHALTARLMPKRHSMSVLECDWVKTYQRQINSPQSCINEWNEMSDILSRRPMSPDELTVLSSDEVDTETLKTVIKSKLREIMKTVDLDEITSKSIRLSLEAEMGQNLNEFKGLIDEEILLILGQMDPASKIFDFLYLGSEWNASNLEELNANGVTHILNVTREIDNFFPAVFKYLNIREYDVEETDLLQYWDRTYRFIRDCVQVGGVCLVHCKMGISRSASTVMAFAMKHFSWTLDTAMKHTKDCRSIVNPNPAFRQQLVTYEGILNASRQRNSFRKVRPKSNTRSRSANKDKEGKSSSLQRSPSEPSVNLLVDIENRKRRPISWSPSVKFLLDLDKKDVEATEDKAQVQYHCYSQLSQYLHDPNTSPCPAPISSTPTLTSTVTNKRFYSLPGQDQDHLNEDDDLDDDAVIVEVHEKPAVDSVSCQQSHLSQCTCDLELELSVSEIPVDLFEETPETIKIMKNIGNLPLQIRHAQPLSAVVTSAAGQSTKIKSNSSQHNIAQSNTMSNFTQNTFEDDSSQVSEATTNETVISQPRTDQNDEGEEGSEDTSVCEELSVKTLANMFDFRLSDPSMTKSLHKLIKESKLDSKCYQQLQQTTIDVKSCSEC